jgi:hypothetical protein
MRGTFRHGLWPLLPAIAMVAGTMMASPVRAATFVYVGNAESNEIYVLQLDRQSGDGSGASADSRHHQAW